MHISQMQIFYSIFTDNNKTRKYINSKLTVFLLNMSFDYIY